MPGPRPRYQPAFAAEHIALCERTMRQHTAPQAQVARAKLAVLLHADPRLDNPAAARQLGKHENWVRYWRRIWATEGFRLADRPGRGRKPAFPPAGRGHRHGAGVRTARPARPAAQPL